MRLHGIPVSIVSNRDPRFASKFWDSFQETMGTCLDMSIGYHPQINGQTELTSQTIEDMICAIVMNFKIGWKDVLLLVEFSYNNS